MYKKDAQNLPAAPDGVHMGHPDSLDVPPYRAGNYPSTPPGCRGLGEQGPGADWASCPEKDGLGLGAGCELSHLPPGTQEGLGSSSKVTTEAKHHTSQLPHCDIFSGLDLSSREN